jgi:hypothetical protein
MRCQDLKFEGIDEHLNDLVERGRWQLIVISLTTL